MERKYLLDGKEVEIVNELPTGGYVVSLVYQYEDSDDIVDTENPFIVKQIFDTPPTEKLDAQVLALETKITELQAKRNELNNEVSRASNAHVEKMKLYKKYQNESVNILDTILENKVTHLVFEQHGNVSVKSMEQVKKDDYQYEFRLKIDLRENKINWEILTKRDYNSYNCFPCESETQALEYAKKLILDFAASDKFYHHDYLIGSAKKLGIELPESYLSARANSKKNSLVESIRTKKGELEKLEMQLSAL